MLFIVNDVGQQTMWSKSKVFNPFVSSYKINCGFFVQHELIISLPIAVPLSFKLLTLNRLIDSMSSKALEKYNAFVFD